MPRPVHFRGDRAGLRPCEHTHAARLVTPHSEGCPECLARGDGWAELWLCLSCGWVACSTPHHTSTPKPTTKKPTTPSPVHCRAAVHSPFGATSMTAPSDLDCGST